MSSEKYYPCLMDNDTGHISRRVAPAMSFEEAVQYLKQHHSGAWQHARASAHPVSHPFFAPDGSTRKSE
jgi:hypothetical protein